MTDTKWQNLYSKMCTICETKPNNINMQNMNQCSYLTGSKIFIVNSFITDWFHFFHADFQVTQCKFPSYRYFAVIFRLKIEYFNVNDIKKCCIKMKYSEKKNDKKNQTNSGTSQARILFKNLIYRAESHYINNYSISRQKLKQDLSSDSALHFPQC
jgi:hypothetical protein